MIIILATRNSSTLYISSDSIESLDERPHGTILTTKTGHRYDLQISEGNYVKDLLKTQEGYVDGDGIFHAADRPKHGDAIS